MIDLALYLPDPGYPFCDWEYRNEGVRIRIIMLFLPEKYRPISGRMSTADQGREDRPEFRPEPVIQNVDERLFTPVSVPDGLAVGDHA